MVPGLENFQSERTVDIILLTIPEAMRLLYGKTRSMVDSAYSQTSSYYHSHSTREIGKDLLGTYKNITDKCFGADILTLKDTLEFLKNTKNLTTYYNQAGNLAFTISALWRVRAKTYILNGNTYIKITGYAGLRQILNGTRYLFNNPQIMKFGVGAAAMTEGIVKGTRYSVLFSGAFHALEFIFKSEYDFADFFVDISMDVAKLMVAQIVLKAVAGIFAGILALSGAPVIIAAAAIIVIGLFIAWGLNKLDSEKYLNLSNILKTAIRSGNVMYAERIMHDAKTMPARQFILLRTMSHP